MRINIYLINMLFGSNNIHIVLKTTFNIFQVHNNIIISIDARHIWQCKTYLANLQHFIIFLVILKHKKDQFKAMEKMQ